MLHKCEYITIWKDLTKLLKVIDLDIFGIWIFFMFIYPFLTNMKNCENMLFLIGLALNNPYYWMEKHSIQLLPLIIYLAAAAKSLQLCPTLCDPTDISPPSSSIHGIFQARVLEWGAIAFSGLLPLVTLSKKNQSSLYPKGEGSV